MAPFLLFRRAGLLLAVAGVVACTGLPAAPDTPSWVASWGTAQMPLGAAQALPDAVWQDGTLRQIVRLSLGGSRVRVRISNVYGTAPLAVAGATIGRAKDSGPAQRLHFGGSATVQIPAGSEIYSDPVDLPVANGVDVAITMALRGGGGRQTGHPGARATSYIAPGNQAEAVHLQGASGITRWHQLADVEVSAAAPARAVVAIGDSITDGYGVAPDTNGRWTDYLVKRLDAAGMRSLGVVNAGIGGGALLRGGIGPPLRSRFERDVLGRSGVSHVIVLAGVNDLGGLHRSGADTPAALATLLGDFQQAHREMLALAHTRGVCVIGATLPPFMGSGYYQPTAANEAMRQALNAWIRMPGVFDGVADVDAALADPARPAFLRPDLDSGDGLHPSQAGYAALADAVPLASLNKCSYSKMPALQ